MINGYQKILNFLLAIHGVFHLIYDTRNGKLFISSENRLIICSLKKETFEKHTDLLSHYKLLCIDPDIHCIGGYIDTKTTRWTGSGNGCIHGRYDYVHNQFDEIIKFREFPFDIGGFGCLYNVEKNELMIFGGYSYAIDGEICDALNVTLTRPINDDFRIEPIQWMFNSTNLIPSDLKYIEFDGNYVFYENKYVIIFGGRMWNNITPCDTIWVWNLNTKAPVVESSFSFYLTLCKRTARLAFNGAETSRLIARSSIQH